VHNKVLITAVFVCLAVSVSNAANTIYVDAASPNDPGTGTSEDPFRRIQDGIDYAVSDDNVVIRPGVYTGPGNYDLDPNGKSIIICSNDPNDPDIIAQTIIDPNRAGRGFYIHTGEDANCVISGLTIKNAYNAETGAGIYCYKSNPTISNCIIKDNMANNYGGAIFCASSGPDITGCTITGNSANSGGALECWPCTAQLTNCIISDNHAVSYGGGVDCYGLGNLILINCTIIGNSLEDGFGGGICSWGSSVNLRNSVIWSNEAILGPQLVLLYDSNASVSYCNVQGGQAEVYIGSGCVLTWDANSNIDADPCFASFDPNGDPNLWDFHLQSKYGRWAPNSQSWVTDSNTSSCIDAGDPNSDWTVEPWPNGKRINMGAYGGTNQASKSGNIADLNIDGIVNFPDLAELGNLWGENQEAIEDLDNSGTIDIGDLDILAENWLWKKQ